MSIEKLNTTSQTSLEENPFTQICNSVTEHIKDNDAYRLYCYLSTKSREWTVIKGWTAKVCGVGDRKAKQCWAYLERAGLIQYMVVRDDKGKFVKYDIRVLNGTQFNPEEPFLKPSGAVSAPLDKAPNRSRKLSTQDDIDSRLEVIELEVIHSISDSKISEIDYLSTEKPIQWCKNPVGGQSTRVGFAPLLNKDLLPNKDCNTKKRGTPFANAGQKMNNSSSFSLSSPHHPRRKPANSRPDWADTKPQMDREAAYITENEAFKRTPPPALLLDMIKKMKCGVAVHR